jgi:hypothetical protein
MRYASKYYMRQLSTPIGEFKLKRLLGKGKSGYSHLAEGVDGYCVVKIMHDEPCNYYQFGDNKVSSEISAFEILRDIGINIPRLYYHDSDKKYLIKEYLDGPTAAKWLVNGGEVQKVLPDLFMMASKSKKSGYNIDFFPTNFVICSNGLFYIDYEINAYDPQWNLVNWGLYYWANKEGLAAYFKTGDPLSINISADSGKPITEPFEEVVDQWIELYSLDRT